MNPGDKMIGTTSLGNQERLTIEPQFAAIMSANRLDSLDALLSTQSGQSLTKPDLADWRERLKIDLNGVNRATVFLKRFGHPPSSVRRQLKRQGQATPAGLEWHWLKRMRQEGLSVPLPVAMGERFSSNGRQSSVVVMQAVPGKSLEWLLAHEAGSWTRSTLAAHIYATARQVALMHQAGYVHRDLYASHLFSQPGDPDPEIYLIDVQRVFRPKQCTQRWVIKDLAALNYSVPLATVKNTARVRWLKRYLGIKKLDEDARKMLYLVVGKTLAIRRHDARRQRRWS